MIDLYPTAHAIDIVSDEPHVCPCCHQLRYWFRNEAGRTKCLDCTEQVAA